MVIALLLQVSLAFPSAHPFPPLTVRTAVAEAATLWAPYGVEIDDDAPGADASADRECLSVVVIPAARPAPRRESPMVLAFIRFLHDGRPAPIITVLVDDLLRIIAAARVVGSREWQWPPVMREQIVGRVLGRVLAHEIGHYMLRSPHHTAGGLMQSVQIADTLVSPERRAFSLSPHERERLSVLTQTRAQR